MRTNVNIDVDVYELASAYAKGNGITLGAAIGELIRRGEQPQQPTVSPRLKRNEQGYLVIARTGNMLTPEMVKEFSEDEIEG
jgi:hypothetical protein